MECHIVIACNGQYSYKITFVKYSYASRKVVTLTHFDSGDFGKWKNTYHVSDSMETAIIIIISPSPAGSSNWPMALKIKLLTHIDPSMEESKAH